MSTLALICIALIGYGLVGCSLGFNAAAMTINWDKYANCSMEACINGSLAHCQYEELRQSYNKVLIASLVGDGLTFATSLLLPCVRGTKVARAVLFLFILCGFYWFIVQFAQVIIGGKLWKLIDDSGCKSPVALAGSVSVGIPAAAVTALLLLALACYCGSICCSNNTSSDGGGEVWVRYTEYVRIR